MSKTRGREAGLPGHRERRTERRNTMPPPRGMRGSGRHEPPDEREMRGRREEPDEREVEDIYDLINKKKLAVGAGGHMSPQRAAELDSAREKVFNVESPPPPDLSREEKREAMKAFRKKRRADKRS